MFDTPILLIIFNRPDTTRQVFKIIRQQKPKYLYVAADGPRPGNQDDIKKCKAAREVINVDWNCELNTLFRDNNRGCGYGPAEAITWFFNHVEAGIILEDDCLPAKSFFQYCKQLLDKYQANEKVFMISGFNPLIKWKNKKKSFILSPIGNSLGWATWRDRWNKFDYYLQSWNTEKLKLNVKKTLKLKRIYNYYAEKFEKYYNTPVKDIWDFQWTFARYSNLGISIIPSINLIKNIGFNSDATHTKNDQDILANLKIGEIKFPLKQSSDKIDWIYTWIVFEKFRNTKQRSLTHKIFYKLIKIIFKVK